MRYSGARLGYQVDLSRLLERPLAIAPDAVGLVTEEGSWTWRELEQLSNDYAANLIASGLSPGDRVASYLPNCSTLIIHFLGTLKAGLVAVPLNYRYTASEIDHALSVSDAKALVYDAERAEQVKESSNASELPVRFIRRGSANGAVDVRTLFVESNGPVEVQCATDDPAMIFFTSGSTGPAKGVTHTRASIGAIAISYGRSMQLSPDDRFMNATSCSHIGGSMKFIGAVLEAAQFITFEVGKIDVQVDLLRKCRPTFLAMLPASLFALERDKRTLPEHFSSLRTVLIGGDKVSAQLKREFFEKSGIHISEAYGMTEAGICHFNAFPMESKPGTVGRTAAGFLAEIRDDAGNPLTHGKEGQLWLKAPNVMQGYWGRPKETSEVFDEDGWFNTGDVMVVDPDGYLYFHGRRKRIIVHDGSNIFPQEVEDSLLDHEAVNSVGVIGIKNPMHGENVRAYVELKKGVNPPSESELIEFSRERVGYKVPEEIVYLPQMPMNAGGKVDRETLKQMAEDAVHGNNSSLDQPLMNGDREWGGNKK
ncbi:MAG: class I adenylate-forming enzyme family protein [Verrucomicrobiota bacterium]